MQFNHAGTQVQLSIQQLVVAGWTGRNRAAVDHHIEELAAIGIAPPSAVPLYYRVSENLATQQGRIQVLGNTSSGEVEPLLVRQADQWWIGLASDHTDRELEAYSVAASKQACAKPLASELWPFSSVVDHLDQLCLHCTILENDQWITYQEGTLASIKPLQELIDAAPLAEHAAMLCGTLGAIGAVRAASHYRMSLTDPVLNRRIDLEYQVDELPIIK